ncbi:MAG TPA: CzcE family metal-binding protein [Burkholderiaceae bacterium]|nr:CzcE family metal-binding protein [Burkholderiaceae bacterium]
MKKLLAIAMASASLVASMAASAAIRPDLMGDKASPDQATRTIVITPSTRYVNVTGGEIVKFEAGGKTYAWNFDGPSVSVFALNDVLPAGALDHKVTAYVAPNADNYN